MPDRAAFVTALILDRPTCPKCIATQSGLSAADLDEILAKIRTALELHSATGRCRTCGATATVLSVDRPSRRPSPHDRALWDFLEQHRGEMFCTHCLAAAIRATGRIDRSVMVAEGRGARRQHGQCGMCGKTRLLCGIT
jgi:hypothetical protein